MAPAFQHTFVQFGATHTGHSFTQGGSNPSISAGGVNTTVLRFENPAYSTYDASAGWQRMPGNAHVYVQNLSNSNASLFTNTGPVRSGRDGGSPPG